MLALWHFALTWVVPYVFVLTVVVTVHELGHFLAAKACGVAVESFSIGFGTPLVRWRDGSGVEWRVGWIPLGGYVRFAGDENASSVPDQDDLSALRQEILAREGPEGLKRYFHFKPLWRRVVVVTAGPLANFALSIFVFAALLMALGETIVPARVTRVEPGSAAQAAGFQVGDLIERADNRKIESFSDVRELVIVRADVPIQFLVRRGGTLVTLTATPRETLIDDGMGGKQKGGLLGLDSKPERSDLIRRRYDPVQAIGEGAVQTWRVLDTTLFYLERIAKGQASASQLTGPLGIARASHAVARAGAEGAHSPLERAVGSLEALSGMIAVVSVGIGFMNLLPIPVLDGGHLLFYAYEAVARRPLAAAVQAAGYRVGLALLLGLMLFATTNDLQHSNVFHFLGGLFS